METSGKRPPPPGSGSSPEEGVTTNAGTGDDLGTWMIQLPAQVYRGVGHLALTVPIGEAELDDGTELTWVNDLGFTRVKCWIDGVDNKRIAVELDGRDLLQQLADVGFRALTTEDGVTVPTRRIQTVEQHLQLLHEALGTTGAEGDLDPYESVKALRAEVDRLRARNGDTL